MIESATSATFAPHVGSVFEVVNGDAVVMVLELVDCRETRFGDPEEWKDAVDRIPFSLEFRAAEGEAPQLEQQIVQLRHAELGEFALFLVPLGPDAAGMRYEAVIS